MSNSKTTQKGTISIHTENIFPIIKKWLYSEHEIFLRELVSNAVDAISKRHKIAIKESLGSVPEGRVNITIDKEKNTITISDNGLGMSEDEIQKYITQIAFSGAEEFLSKYDEADEKSGIIGHFGLGFYSSFMVASKVEIDSLSYQKDATPAHWTCTGSTEYEISEGSRTEVGTDIILHISADQKEYLEDARIETLIKKYANFLPIEIALNGEVKNDQNPLWTKSPQDLEDKDYKEFYQSLFPFQQEPLFWIHLNVDHPFNLQGILYFPRVTHELESHKSKIKLFCKQVFVTDNSENVLPEFLTVLQGCIDCPELPLNVSRSALQNDPYIQKISKHVVKKVADKLNQISKQDKAEFETMWQDIHPFIKYGMMNDEEFYKKCESIIIFESTTGEFTNLPDYASRNEKGDAEKTTVIYSTDKNAQASTIATLKEKGKEILLLDAMIDSHFIQFLEFKANGYEFKSVDAVAAEQLKSGEETSEEDKNKHDELIKTFKTDLGNDALNVEVSTFDSEDIPAILKVDESMKRMSEMSRMMGGNSGMGDLSMHTVVLNSNNPAVKLILNNAGTDKNPDRKLMSEHVYDLARMASKPLEGSEMAKFIKRSQTLLIKSSQA